MATTYTGGIYFVIGTPGVNEGVIPTIVAGTNISNISGPESDGVIWESIIKVDDIDNFSFTVHCDKYRVYTVTNADISNWTDSGSGVDKSALLEINMIATPEELFGYTKEDYEILYAWDVSGSNSSATPSTIYTKTETIDASTEYFNADGSQLDITTITFDGYTATGLKWFSNSSVPTIAFDCNSNLTDPTVPIK